MKGKALRKHSLHKKTAASVLLKLFISGNEKQLLDKNYVLLVTIPHISLMLRTLLRGSPLLNTCNAVDTFLPFWSAVYEGEYSYRVILIIFELPFYFATAC